MSCTVHFNKTFCVIQDLHLRTLIGVGERRDGLYYFCDLPSIGALSVEESFMELWHQKLGHPFDKVVSSLPFFVNLIVFLIKLVVCHQAKQSREKFSISDSKATTRFEIIHCDLWGKYHIPSSYGATYVLTHVDDYSRAVWVYLLFDKTEVYKMFSSFHSMIDRKFDAKVKVVHSYNGTEFNCMKEYLIMLAFYFSPFLLILLNKMEGLNVNIVTY